MARYRRISICMWGDEKFRTLSAPKPNAQTLWVYLLTGPHTLAIPGLSHIGELGLSEALRWPLGAFREKFREILDQGMVESDWENLVLWIPNALEHNPPESPNVVKAWAKSLVEVPECELRKQATEEVVEFLRGLDVEKPEAFVKAFQEALPEAHTKDFAEQEQEQEQEQDIPPYSPPRGGNSELVRLRQIFDDARKLYPGTKRGLDTEFDYFRTNPKTRKDWRETVHYLRPAIEVLIVRRQEKQARNEFVPEWKNFKTWIYNRCWEEAIENG